MKKHIKIKTLLPKNANSRDRSAKGCIAVRAVKGCRMRVENVCGPAPAGGTRRHHEADAQLSGTEAQHPSQPVPARRRMCVKQASPRTRTAKTSLPYANKASSLTAAQQRHNATTSPRRSRQRRNVVVSIAGRAPKRGNSPID